MIQIKNPSCFDVLKKNTQLTIYGASKTTPLSVSSFEEALRPDCYAQQYTAFAYVIINQTTHEFLLVRDHLGVQPLFYAYQAESNTLVFGDTIPDVLSQLEPKPQLLDARARQEFIEPRYYSTQTLYQGIYRADSGHIIHGRPDGKLTKKAFWELAREGETLYYQDKREYLDHFSELMRESIQDATRGIDSSHIAAEFSAGIDSTAVYLASTAQGLHPTLFMHAATPGSSAEASYDKSTEEAFLYHYKPNLYRMDASCFDADFDLIEVFKTYSEWFAGPAPYIFEAFAHPLHRAVSKKGYTILLSGFGGDQGVSGHVLPRYILPELLKGKAFREVWHLLSKDKPSRRLLKMMQYSYPLLYRFILSLQDFRTNVRNLRKPLEQQQLISVYPQQRAYFKNLRDVEWQLLQGTLSHEIRMRVESSSIVAKKMGFEYRYPLLHPKLLDFYLSLPLSEKRNEVGGRYLIRRYLARYLPDSIFNHYCKRTGLNILPATMDDYKAKFSAGAFQSVYHELPYPELVQDKMEHMTMVKSVRAFMLKSWLGDDIAPPINK